MYQQPPQNPNDQHHYHQHPQQPPLQQQAWMAAPPQHQAPPPPQAGGYMGWGAQPAVPVQYAAGAAGAPASQYGIPAAASVGVAQAGSNEIRSLWIGDLQPWMDESYLTTVFSYTGEVASAKVIRNKQTGMSEGYGFIEFATHAAAERVLLTVNGTPMPQTEQNFRLNWATLGAGERRQNEGPDHTIFVGDLAADVTDYVLQETFKAVYPSVKGAKVVIDRATGRSKGYGFVKFGEESEQMRAMNEMNGVLCSTRPMRIGPAANKNPVGIQTNQKAAYQTTQVNQGNDDPNNTTIFVGNLDSSVTDDLLKQVFSQFGEIVHVKIPVGKRCGFVEFANRNSAEQALSMLNGSQLGGQSIRLSWGRSLTNKQPDQTQGNGGSYGYPQGYEAYGYAPPTQDPSMYYGGYAGYANYQQQPGAYQQPPQ